ncbi:hypothetical protein Ocin01_18704 [Orchesella cincta]|uniref:Uncharacterized protein n=1 Tax=Orchesella cincta TaxID=48709 RepID=A0A1D2M4S9_ORCCI|nr:hypothetical protein Ocin01_18704 [Orchesella cincta]
MITYLLHQPIEISDLNHVMKMGCEKYNIQLNQGKSETNMLVRSNIPISPRFCDTVTFCGWNFCLTVPTSPGLQKVRRSDFMFDSGVSTKNTESPEHFIRLRGTVITSARLKPIVIDPTINCNRRILLTTFEASAFLSFRFYAICRVVYQPCQ